jgi:hypothetical protein
MDGIFWSATTGGFYHERVHGMRQISVEDETANDAAFEAAAALDAAAYDDAVAAVVGFEPAPNRAAFHRHVTDAARNLIMKTVDNPDCTLPADAVSIPAELHAALIEAQASGKDIAADESGIPVAVDRVVSADRQIEQLRARRDGALRASDWAEFTRRLPVALRKKWLAYRDQLFDLPALAEKALANGKTLDDLTFPTAPS